jgi:hypothetical protein
VTDFALGGTYVYFAALKSGGGGVVSRVPKDGGAAEVLADGQNQPAGIAVDDSSVFWTCRGTEQSKFEDGTLSRRDHP